MLPTETATTVTISAPPLPVRRYIVDQAQMNRLREACRRYQYLLDRCAEEQIIENSIWSEVIRESQNRVLVDELEGICTENEYRAQEEESVRILADMPDTPESQHGSLEATQVYDGPEPLEYALFPESRRPESVWTGSEAMGPLSRLLDDAYYRGHNMV